MHHLEARLVDYVLSLVSENNFITFRILFICLWYLLVFQLLWLVLSMKRGRLFLENYPPNLVLSNVVCARKCFSVSCEFDCKINLNVLKQLARRV